jgi:hypothetical protein
MLSGIFSCITMLSLLAVSPLNSLPDYYSVAVKNIDNQENYEFLQHAIQRLSLEQKEELIHQLSQHYAYLNEIDDYQSAVKYWIPATLISIVCFLKVISWVPQNRLNITISLAELAQNWGVVVLYAALLREFYGISHGVRAYVMSIRLQSELQRQRMQNLVILCD